MRKASIAAASCPRAAWAQKNFSPKVDQSSSDFGEHNEHIPSASNRTLVSSVLQRISLRRGIVAVLPNLWRNFGGVILEHGSKTASGLGWRTTSLAVAPGAHATSGAFSGRLGFALDSVRPDPRFGGYSPGTRTRRLPARRTRNWHGRFFRDGRKNLAAGARALWRPGDSRARAQSRAPTRLRHGGLAGSANGTRPSGPTGIQSWC